MKDLNSRFYEYDARGVRAIVRYSEANGCWRIECYRKIIFFIFVVRIHVLVNMLNVLMSGS